MLRNAWNTLYGDLRRNKKVLLQTVVLFGAQIIVIILGLGIKGIQTRGLGAENYGLYAFFTTVTGFLVLVYQFAHHDSLKVLLAENKEPDKERDYFGLGLLVALAIGFLFAITVYLISFGIDLYFSESYGQIYRLFAPLTSVFPLYYMIGDLSVGSNRIYPSALADVSAKSLFLIPLYIIYTSGDLTLEQVVFYNLLTLFIAVVGVFIWLKPRFRNLKVNYKILKQKNKDFGWDIYFGSVSNQTTYKLDEIFITFFINTTQLGFYTLASIICSPMVHLSKALTSALYKRFATSKKVPAKVFIYNTLWLLACVVGLYFLSDLIVYYLFGEEFSKVGEFVVLLSLAYFFQGAYQPFSFLTAKSQGRSVRNVAFAEAIVNVVGNIFLILWLDIYGVILASILARLTHFLGLYYYYNQFIKTTEDR